MREREVFRIRAGQGPQGVSRVEGFVCRGPQADKGFVLEQRNGAQHITHKDAEIFQSWGFVNEEPAERQLTLMHDLEP